MKRFSIILAVLGSILAAGCGGSSSSGPSTPANLPVSIEGLDGRADIATDSTFRATFSEAVSSSSVTETSFFIVEGATSVTAAYDTTVCNSDNRIDASITAVSSVIYDLDPTSDLSASTGHTVCVAPSITTADAGGILSLFMGTAHAAISVDGVGKMYSFSTGLSTSRTLLDGSLNAIADTGTTGVDGRSFRFIFAEADAMTAADAATVTTAGNVTLVEGSGLLEAPDITVTKAMDEDGNSLNNAFNITLDNDDGWKYQLLPIKLTFTANITTGGGTPLPSELIYQFTPGLAMFDDFNADSNSGWTPSSGNDWTTWADLKANIFEFDTANSQLIFTGSGASDNSIYKDVILDTDDNGNALGFTTEIKFNTGTNLLQDNDYLLLSMQNEGAERMVYVEVAGVDGVQTCTIAYVEDSDDDGEYDIFDYVWDECPTGNVYCLKVEVLAGQDSIAGYMANDEACSTYGELVPGPTPLPDPDDKILDIDATWRYNIRASSASDDARAEVMQVKNSGLHHAAQY